MDFLPFLCPFRHRDVYDGNSLPASRQCGAVNMQHCSINLLPLKLGEERYM